MGDAFPPSWLLSWLLNEVAECEVLEQSLPILILLLLLLLVAGHLESH
jgi:hypothetical protein